MRIRYSWFVLTLFLIFSFLYTSACYALSAKNTIMVGPFEVRAGLGAAATIGQPLQDMMTEALQHSGRFIVTERPQIQAGLAEQDFAQSGRTSSIGAPQIGKITNARIMVTGAVTEFDPGVSGSRAGINIGGFGASSSSATAYVAVTIRLVDTTTMQVIDSQRVEGRANAKGGSIGYQGGSFGGSLGGFRKTPVGSACQQAVNAALAFIIQRMDSVPSYGSIASIDQYGIIINLGGESGVSIGSRFNVLRSGAEIIDPTTGVSLGSREQLVGTIEVITVDPRFATATAVSGDNFVVGDKIQLVP